MNLVAWIFFGLISGVLANLIDPEPSQGGLIGAIILGILGSLLGGFLANLVFGVEIVGFNFTSFIVAVGGSLLLLFLGRAFRSSEL